jgi:sugar/nucleoside kinase (ribokinase family)
MDYLYTDIDFSSAAFARLLSRTASDGGLKPGGLVFLEDFERFSGRAFHEILRELAGDRKPDAANLGGPSVVSLINAAQLLEGDGFRVRFYGARGRDGAGDELAGIVAKTPLDVSGYAVVEGLTPFTQVLSDPRFDGGHGERTFVNNIGAAWNYHPDDLPDRFFDSDIVAFGGTALTPRIHDGLGTLAPRARKNGAIVVVNTVYDFRNQARNPDGLWPLGSNEDLTAGTEAYPAVDLLITDREEALHLSGEGSVEAAIGRFRSRGVGAAIVTEGARNLVFYSDGSVFGKTEPKSLPVSARVSRELASGSVPKGDTTGCGDNFAGGVIASVANQLHSGARRGMLDLEEASSWGVSSGGFCCFYVGGTYTESKPGEKRARVEAYYRDYRTQIGKA